MLCRLIIGLGVELAWITALLVLALRSDVVIACTIDEVGQLEIGFATLKIAGLACHAEILQLSHPSRIVLHRWLHTHAILSLSLCVGVRLWRFVHLRAIEGKVGFRVTMQFILAENYARVFHDNFVLIWRVQ